MLDILFKKLWKLDILSVLTVSLKEFRGIDSSINIAGLNKFTKKTLKEVLTVIEITAPMGGKVIDVKVNPGDTVNEGDEVVIIEAMKMELPIVANASGTVKEVKCKKGDAVEAEAVIVVLEWYIY